MYETFYALVVNPRGGRIAQCILQSSYDIAIADMRSGDIGGGEWNTSMGERSEHVTGMPRVHLSGGVSPAGEGWGTVLYTALAVGAAAHAEGVLPLARMRTAGRGISSDPAGRSESASAWWDRAIAAGLAYRDESDADIDGSAFDAYPEENARARHLLLARFPNPEEGVTDWWDYEVDGADAVDAEALAAVDLSEFGPLLVHSDLERRDRYERQLLWLLELGEAAGLSGAVLGGMRDRARSGSDVRSHGGILSVPNPPSRRHQPTEGLDERRRRLGWPSLAAIERGRSVTAHEPLRR
jgi:hypothetical protein